MDLPSKILSDIAVYMKYARYLPKKKRRETWKELVTRNKKMHIKKYPDLKGDIEEAYNYVYAKKVLPSFSLIHTIPSFFCESFDIAFFVRLFTYDAVLFPVKDLSINN